MPPGGRKPGVSRAGGARKLLNWKAVITSNRNPNPRTHNTAQTTVYRGHATAWPRAHQHNEFTPIAADFAEFYNTSPEQLDLEAARQSGLHLLPEKKLSPERINTFVSSVQFLYLTSLPWARNASRACAAYKLPLVPSPEEVSQFFESVPSLKYRAALMTCYRAGLRISEAVSLKVSDISSYNSEVPV